MVAQDGYPGDLDYLVETFSWIGAVANDIAKAEDLVDILLLNVGQYRLESFQITVNITNQGSSHVEHLSQLPSFKQKTPNHIL